MYKQKKRRQITTKVSLRKM